MVKTNIWYFLDAGIGGLFLAVHTIESAYFELPVEKRGRVYVVSRLEVQAYKEFIEQHPHIEVIFLTKKTFIKTYMFMLSKMKDCNIVFHAPVLSRPALPFVVANILFKVSNRKNAVVGFSNKHFGWRRYTYTKLLHLDIKIPIFKLATASVQALFPKTVYKRPSLLFSINPPQIKSEYIIIHPFPSNIPRTLPNERWTSLLEHLHKTYPLLQIIITGSQDDYDRYVILNKNKLPRVSFVYENVKTINEVINLVARCKIFIGVDTGMTHLASIFNKHTVVIGNNSNPYWLPVYSNNSIILKSDKGCLCKGDKQGGCGVVYEGERYLACVYNIEDKEIYDTIEVLINRIT